MRRLYLTDDQSELVVAALRLYSRNLQIDFDIAIKNKDNEASENINNVMNRLDDILDIMTED